MIELSIVIPVYGCKDCLVELHRRILKVLSKITSRYEIIFVEDGGKDNSWNTLKIFSKTNSRIKAFRLSRNFGQHAAITAGLSKAQGFWTIVMDCDLQDPPEEIPRLLKKAREGFDVVLMKRNEKKTLWFRRMTAGFYFKLLNFFNQEQVDAAQGNFSLLSRTVREAYLRVQDRDRHYLFVLRWLGFRSTVLEYEQHERFRGKSSYNFKTLMTHAFNGLFFQTTVFLKWIVYLGFVLSATGFLLAIYFIFLYLSRSILPGWTSLSVLILLLGGFTITSIGIMGLYVGKIFEQVKQRPLYVFDQEVIHEVSPKMASQKKGSGIQ